jgi:3-oxoacyl-[acyl-carrier-protein] synthase II
VNEAVVITGMGAVSAFGSGVDKLWHAVTTGQSGIRRVERLSRLGLRVTTGGCVPGPEGLGADRHLAIARRAIDDAIEQAHLDVSTSAFIWATGLDTYVDESGRPTYRRSGDCFAALAARHRSPRRLVAVACASGTQAIGEAAWLIRTGRADACVAGGSSAMLDAVYTTAFAGLGAIAVDKAGENPGDACRPFDRQRRGFALSEGAGALVIERASTAQARGVAPLALVTGLGTSEDAHDLNQPPADGGGAELAILRSLADAHLEPDGIDVVNSHGTGTFVGDASEAAAIRSVFKNWRERPLVHGLKGAIGHAMSAAGAIEAIVAVMTCREGVVPATVNLCSVDEACSLRHVVGSAERAPVRRVLSSSFGMGGQNAAIIIERVCQ